MDPSLVTYALDENGKLLTLVRSRIELVRDELLRVRATKAAVECSRQQFIGLAPCVEHSRKVRTNDEDEPKQQPTQPLQQQPLIRRTQREAPMKQTAYGGAQFFRDDEIYLSPHLDFIGLLGLPPSPFTARLSRVLSVLPSPFDGHPPREPTFKKMDKFLVSAVLERVSWSSTRRSEQRTEQQQQSVDEVIAAFTIQDDWQWIRSRVITMCGLAHLLQDGGTVVPHAVDLRNRFYQQMSSSQFVSGGGLGGGAAAAAAAVSSASSEQQGHDDDDDDDAEENEDEVDPFAFPRHQRQQQQQEEDLLLRALQRQFDGEYDGFAVAEQDVEANNNKNHQQQQADQQQENQQQQPQLNQYDAIFVQLMSSPEYRAMSSLERQQQVRQRFNQQQTTTTATARQLQSPWDRARSIMQNVIAHSSAVGAFVSREDQSADRVFELLCTSDCIEDAFRSDSSDSPAAFNPFASRSQIAAFAEQSARERLYMESQVESVAFLKSVPILLEEQQQHSSNKSCFAGSHESNVAADVMWRSLVNAVRFEDEDNDDDDAPNDGENDPFAAPAAAADGAAPLQLTEDESAVLRDVVVPRAILLLTQNGEQQQQPQQQLTTPLFRQMHTIPRVARAGRKGVDVLESQPSAWEAQRIFKGLFSEL